MHSSSTTVLVSLLASVATVLTCSYHKPQSRSLHPVAEPERVVKRDVQAGGNCGRQHGNAACAPGLCCAERGVCGTGDFCFSPGCQIDIGRGCQTHQSPGGKSTADVPRPKFGEVGYGVNITHCAVPGKMALTFDDGPKEYTNELLDILKKNNVKATFFVVGNNNGKGQIEDPATGYPDIIHRMWNEGHQIASHSWSHEDFTLISPDERRNQIVKLETALVQIIGVIPTYIRPPYDNQNDEVVRDLDKYGYHNIYFDLDTHDWEKDMTMAQRQSGFTTELSRGSASNSFIAVAHDIQESTVHGYAQFMIEQARARGLDLVTVGECLGDHPNNWYRNSVTGAEWNGPAPAKQPPAKQPAGPASSAPGPAGQATATGSQPPPAPSTSAKSSTTAAKPSGGPSTTAVASVAETSKPNGVGRNGAGVGWALGVWALGGLVFRWL